MSAGAYGSYITLYYTVVGLDTIQIGLIGALSAVISIIVQPFWGLIGDRAKYKNNILFICTLITAFSIWLIPMSGNLFWLIVIFTLLFTVFQCAIYPLSTTVTLELASKFNFKFSSVRTVGSLGFALMSFLAGWIIKYNIFYIFGLYSIIMFIALGLIPFLSKVKGHQKEGKKVNLSEIIKNRKLIYIFIYTLFIQSTISFFFSFQAIFSKEQGISTELIGLGLLVGSVSQFPFMLMFDRIYKKFGIIKIILFSGVIQAIRLILFAFFLSSKTIVLIWILHGGTVILIALCLLEYVNSNVLPELRASGQMMNAIVLQGLSTILGSLVGGICAHMTGLKFTFVINAVLCVLAVGVFWIVVKNTSVFKEHRTDQDVDTVSSH